MAKSNIENETQKVTRKNFTTHYGNLHKFLTSDEVVKEFAALLQTSTIEVHHRVALSQLLIAINSIIINCIAQDVHPHQNHVVIQDVRKMPAEGRAKVRYCIGWAIFRVFMGCRQYVSLNMHSQHSNVKEIVKQNYAKKKLLEHLSADADDLHESSSHQETLVVLYQKKYDNGILFYVPYEAYEFGLDVEQARIKLINISVLQGAKGEMISNALSKAQADNALKAKWPTLFDNIDEETVKSNHSSKSLQELEELFDAVLSRYMKMGASQFFRDFRRDFNIKKPKLTGNV